MRLILLLLLPAALEGVGVLTSLGLLLRAALAFGAGVAFGAVADSGARADDFLDLSLGGLPGPRRAGIAPFSPILVPDLTIVGAAP